MHKNRCCLLVILALLVIAAYAKPVGPKWCGKKYVPKLFCKKDGFIGLDRAGVYTITTGGGPGVPGMDPNTSDWV